jgi:hypothetical protein
MYLIPLCPSAQLLLQVVFTNRAPAAALPPRPPGAIDASLPTVRSLVVRHCTALVSTAQPHAIWPFRRDASLHPAPLLVACPGTMKRPVPLEHSMYYCGEIYPICSREVFNADGVRRAQAAYKARNAQPERGGSGFGGGGGRGGGGGGGAAGGGRGWRGDGGRGGGGGGYRGPPSGADAARRQIASECPSGHTLVLGGRTSPHRSVSGCGCDTGA